MKCLIGLKRRRIFAGWKTAVLEREWARRAEMSDKGGAHEVGAVVFTVSAFNGVPVE
jgi:hypothetical protein